MGYQPVASRRSRQRVGTPAAREAAQPPVPPPAPRRHRCRGGGKDALFASVTEHILGSPRPVCRASSADCGCLLQKPPQFLGVVEPGTRNPEPRNPERDRQSLL